MVCVMIVKLKYNRNSGMNDVFYEKVSSFHVFKGMLILDFLYREFDNSSSDMNLLDRQVVVPTSDIRYMYVHTGSERYSVSIEHF